MITSLLNARSRKQRTLAVVTLLFFAGVLLCAPCRVLAAAAAPAPHECCSDHCSHDEQDKSQGCETLCAAKSAKLLTPSTTSVEPTWVVGPVIGSAHDQHRCALPTASIDPANPGLSPPLYVKHAALLI